MTGLVGSCGEIVAVVDVGDVGEDGPVFLPRHEVCGGGHAEPCGGAVVTSVCHVKRAVDADDSGVFAASGGLVGLCGE